MALNNQPLIFNLDKTYNLFNLNAKQYDTDNARGFTFYLVQNGKPFNLTGITLAIGGKKPDGHDFLNNITKIDIDKSIIQVDLTTQMLACDGILNLELILMKDSIRLSSYPFKINVIPSVTNFQAVESSDEFGTLMEALKVTNDYNSILKEGADNLELKYATNLNQNSSNISSYSKICSESDILLTAFNTEIENLDFYIIKNGDVIKVNDNPVLSEGVRDPAMIYKDGIFYCAYSRFKNNRNGFGLSTSKDLINWEINFIDVPGYSRCWAPEFYEENGKMYIVFSLCINDACELDKYNNSILRFNQYYAELDLATLQIKDINPFKYSKVSNKIDATLFLENGVLYNFVKNEFNKTIECYTGTSIDSNFEYKYTVDFPRDIEGPSIVKQNNKYLMSFDLFSDGYSVICESTDLINWSNFKALGDLILNKNFRISHGHMTSISKITAPIINNLKLKTKDRFKLDTFKLPSNNDCSYNLADYVKNNVLEIPEKDNIIFKIFAKDSLTINSIKFISQATNSFKFAMLQSVENQGSVIINDTNDFSLPNGNSLIIGPQYAGQIIEFTRTNGKFLSSTLDNSKYNNKNVKLEDLADGNGYIDTLYIRNNYTYSLSSVKNIVINNVQYAIEQKEPIKIYFLIGHGDPNAKITINPTGGSRIFIRNTWSINGANDGDKYFSFIRPYYSVWQDALRINN